MALDNRRLYIGNLPGTDEISAEDLQDRFSSFGCLNLKKCWFGQMEKGYAFIEFHDSSDARKAFNSKNNGGFYIYSHRVKVDWARPKNARVEEKLNVADASSSSRVDSRMCYSCKEFGHVIKDCPKSKHSSVVSYPNHWPASVNNSVVKRITVTKEALLQKLSTDFKSSIGKTVEIIKIEEICNTVFYQKYETQKEIMKNKLSRNINEKLLYHGTTAGTVDKICAQNFDFRLCGKNATAYGKGSYFAKNASYSHDYTTEDGSNVRYMFLANVLVGKYALGNENLTRPPEFQSSRQNHELYDSCVNDLFNPTIFVIFERDQCYPKYLISYKLVERSQDSYRSHTISAQTSAASNHTIRINASNPSPGLASVKKSPVLHSYASSYNNYTPQSSSRTRYYDDDDFLYGSSRSSQRTSSLYNSPAYSYQRTTTQSKKKDSCIIL